MCNYKQKYIKLEIIISEETDQQGCGLSKRTDYQSAFGINQLWITWLSSDPSEILIETVT